MFETAVGDGSEELWFQEKVTKASGVNADIATLLICVAAGYGQVAFFRGSIRCHCWLCCSRVVGLKLFIRIVDEILFGGHDVDLV